MTERVAFQAKINLQVLSRRVPHYDLTTDCQQNGTMKNDQQRRANSEADQQTLPNPPVASHQFLIVPGHQSDCIAAVPESKCRLLATGLRHCVLSLVA
jgi:hypothetical protein